MNLIKLLFLLFIPLFVSAQRVAITLDDAPFGYSAGMRDEDKVKAVDKILASLDQFKIQATFFVTSGNITIGNQRILDRIKKANHLLGNHTHRHFNFNQVTAATYISDIDSCKYLAGKWLNTNYFRYSMLRRGDTYAKRDSVYAHLKKEGYTIAPVSIDNNEWIYNRDYSRAMRNDDQTEMDRIAAEYLDHMKEFSKNYRQSALELISREVNHVLLIHANPINADYLDELLEWYQSEGWEFISLKEALTDDIYQMDFDWVGRRGHSVLDLLKFQSTSEE